MIRAGNGSAPRLNTEKIAFNLYAAAATDPSAAKGRRACFETAPSAPPQHEGANMMAFSSVIPDRPKA
jgi:hypothetical protein